MRLRTSGTLAWWPLAIWTCHERTNFQFIKHSKRWAILSGTLLVLSFLGGVDRLFLGSGFSAVSVGNPEYFIAAVGSYLALGVIALFTVVPKAERGYIAPIVPLYLFYAIAHIVPMSLGFANWISVKLWRRRIYHDHYEPRLRGPDPAEKSEESVRRAA